MSPSAIQRATKIVATIGTKSGTPDMLLALSQAGVNVFRLNFSHGTQAEHATRIRAIRDLEAATGLPTCILADLQGPKHRVGEVAERAHALRRRDLVTGVRVLGAVVERFSDRLELQLPGRALGSVAVGEASDELAELVADGSSTAPDDEGEGEGGGNKAARATSGDAPGAAAREGGDGAEQEGR